MRNNGIPTILGGYSTRLLRNTFEPILWPSLQVSGTKKVRFAVAQSKYSTPSH